MPVDATSLINSLAMPQIWIACRQLQPGDALLTPWLGRFHIRISIAQALPIYDKLALTVDIGGGSTEIVLGLDGQPLYTASMRLGHLRLQVGHAAVAHCWIAWQFGQQSRHLEMQKMHRPVQCCAGKTQWAVDCSPCTCTSRCSCNLRLGPVLCCPVQERSFPGLLDSGDFSHTQVEDCRSFVRAALADAGVVQELRENSPPGRSFEVTVGSSGQRVLRLCVALHSVNAAFYLHGDVEPASANLITLVI